MLVWEALKKSQRLSEQKSGTDIGFSHIYFQKNWEQPEQFSWLEIICYLVLLPDMRLAEVIYRQKMVTHPFSPKNYLKKIPPLRQNWMEVD